MPTLYNYYTELTLTISQTTDLSADNAKHHKIKSSHNNTFCEMIVKEQGPALKMT